jgi:hypothetical protein
VSKEAAQDRVNEQSIKDKKCADVAIYILLEFEFKLSSSESKFEEEERLEYIQYGEYIGGWVDRCEEEKMIDNADP